MGAEVYDMSGRRWSQSDAGQRDWRAQVVRRVAVWNLERAAARAAAQLRPAAFAAEARRLRVAKTGAIAAAGAAAVVFAVAALLWGRSVVTLTASAVVLVVVIGAAWKAGR